MVIPVTPSENYLLIKSYRHPTKRHLWEFPAGVMEQGESPIESGRRELVEETGITPSELKLLGSQVPVSGFVGHVVHSFVAKIPEITLADITLQSEEGIVDALLLSRNELIELLTTEELGDGVTLSSLARYWMWQESNPSEQNGEA